MGKTIGLENFQSQNVGQAIGKEESDDQGSDKRTAITRIKNSFASSDSQYLVWHWRNDCHYFFSHQYCYHGYIHCIFFFFIACREDATIDSTRNLRDIARIVSSPASDVISAAAATQQSIDIDISVRIIKTTTCIIKNSLQQ